MMTRRFMSIPTPLDTLTSGLASVVCLPFGVTVVDPSSPPPKRSASSVRLIRLYDVENSPQCRRVRERITELDLVVETVVPAAPNSRAAAAIAVRQQQLGYDEDDESDEDGLVAGHNNGDVMVVPTLVASTTTTTTTTGSDSGNGRIVVSGAENVLSFLDESFLPRTSGDGVTITADASVPDVDGADDVARTILNYLHLAGTYVAGWMRVGRGTKVASCAIAAAATSSSSSETMSGGGPARPLILYSYEGNQFCRLVREVLTELDITYELRSAGKGSTRRAELASITGGSTQCPYLIDPNTGASMAESKDIVRYLYDNYALWTPPSELLEWTSDNVMSLAKPLFKILAPLQAGARNNDVQDSNSDYQRRLADAKRSIQRETTTDLIVIYTYDWSPFSSETKVLLDRLKLEYKEISLGREWIPGLVAPEGAIKRAALLDMTGQSSLPHIFIGGKPIGGLFSGQPGLLPLLRDLKLPNALQKQARAGSVSGMFE
jgi:glutaredoxin